MKPGSVNDVMHRKRGLRIFEIWEKAVNWVPASERDSRDSELGEARQICALRVGLRADDVKAVSIERLCLSLLR